MDYLSNVRYSWRILVYNQKGERMMIKKNSGHGDQDTGDHDQRTPFMHFVELKLVRIGDTSGDPHLDL